MADLQENGCESNKLPSVMDRKGLNPLIVEVNIRKPAQQGNINRMRIE
jgi:hypothetical protein